MYKKPHKESYSNALNTSILSSINASLATRASHSRKRHPSKLESGLRQSRSKDFYRKGLYSIHRKTIYMDEKNNIINKSFCSHRGSRSKYSNKVSNIPGVVFESENPSQKCIWDDVNLMNDSVSEINQVKSPKFFNKRFKSPAVIPEMNRTLIQFGAKFKKLKSGKRIKSISPESRHQGLTAFKNQRYNFLLQKSKIIKRKPHKLKMKTKISRLMETFQSIPIKIEKRRNLSKQLA